MMVKYFWPTFELVRSLGLDPGPGAWPWCLALVPGPGAWSWCLVLVPGPGPGQVHAYPTLLDPTRPDPTRIQPLPCYYPTPDKGLERVYGSQIFGQALKKAPKGLCSGNRA